MKLAALLLATLWLPATLHCQLESLGLDPLFACAEQAAESNHASNNDCADEACQTIESGQFALAKSKLDLSLLPALACVFVTCCQHLTPPAPAPEIFAIRQEMTLPLQRTWQFTRRAALPARAPSVVG
jgi:hypothetical protein